MKKFLAWVLVVLTIATSLPLAVVADEGHEHEHTVVSETRLSCGGPEATHTKATCSATFVETRASTCRSRGYSVYRCNECNTAFADDFVEVDLANHVWEIVEAREPTCVDIGWNRHRACSECGVVDPAMPREEYAPLGNGVTGHQWDGIYYEGTCMSEEGVLRYTCCSVCGEKLENEVGVFVPGSDKDHCWEAEPEIVTLPTCDENGEAVYRCENCTDVEKSVAILAMGHLWSEEYPASEPTCTEEGGEAHYKCLRPGCDAVAQGPDYIVRPRDEVITPALQHDWVVTYEENASAPGTDMKVETCRRCGEVKKTPMDPGVHDFGPSITEPAACNKPGRVYHVCRACGHEETIEELSTPPHAWGEWDIMTPLTCGQDGVKRHTCGACGTVETVVTEATGEHNFVLDTDRGDNGIQRPATCEEDGVRYVRCTVCSAEKTEIIPHPGHVDKWVVVTPATCTSEGVRNRVCATCGEMLEENVRYYEPHLFEVEGGAPADRTEDKAAAKWYIEPVTCLTDGVRYLKCMTCQQKIDFTVDEAAKGHHDTLEEAIARGTEITYAPQMTCTTNGYASWICGGCPDSVACSQVLTAPGHTEVTVVVPANCTTKGYTYVYCTADGCVDRYVDTYEKDGVHYPTTNQAGEAVRLVSFEITENINRLAHDLQPVSTEESTCSTRGKIVSRCSRCSSLITMYLDTLPHVGTKTPAVAPTCTADGNYEYYTCNDCSALYTVDADGVQHPATAESVIHRSEGHTLSSLIPQSPATCSLPGMKAHYICMKCSVVFDEQQREVSPETLVIDYLPHTWQVVTASPSDCVAGTVGKKAHYACSVCGWLTLDPNAVPIQYVTAEDVNLPPTHFLTYVNPVPSGCGTEGTLGYYVCGICGKRFADAEGQSPVTDADLIDPADGHTYVPVEAKAPTCGQPGHTAHFTCSGGCGKLYVDRNGEKVEVTAESIRVPFANGDLREYASPEAAARDHTGLRRVSITPATCTDPGVAVYICDTCNTEGIRIPEAALGHLYSDGQNADYADDGVSIDVPEYMKQYTCNGTFVIAYVCAREDCGEHIPTRQLDNVGTHVPGESLALEATCTTDGWAEHYLCTLCGLYLDPDGRAVEDRSIFFIPRHHDLTLYPADPATCTKPGMYAYGICKACGQYVDADGVEVSGPEDLVEPVKPHNYSEYIDSVPSTCITHGTVGHRTCATCDNIFDYNGKLYTGPMELELAAHVLGELVEEVAPTCSVPGCVAYYPCTICDARFADAAGKVELDDTSIETIPHTSVPTPDEAPTCAGTGTTGGMHCEVCGAVTVEPTVVPATGVHGTTLADSKTDALCGHYNYDHYDCPTCNLTRADVEYIILGDSPVEHNYVLNPFYEGTQELTCTQDGIQYLVCIICGDAQADVTLAEGHKNAAGETIDPACNSAAGDRFCVKCGFFVPLEHTWETTVEPSTCLKAGYTIDYCANCPEWRNFVSLPAAAEGEGHSYTETVTTEATYGLAGAKHFRCALCGDEYDVLYHLGTAGVRYTVTAENIHGGEMIADSSLVRVTVTLTSDLGVDLGGMKFALNYNAQEMEFVAVESTGAGFVLTSAQDDGRGTVAMVFDSRAADGKPSYVTVGAAGTVAVVLTLRVASSTATETDLGVTVTETTAHPATSIPSETMPATVYFAKFLDCTGDGIADEKDFEAATELYEKNAYDVRMDVDKDGILTLADLDKYYRYLMGQLTYEQLTALSE